MTGLPKWTLAAPLFGGTVIAVSLAGVLQMAGPVLGPAVITAISAAGLIASVLAAVHHAEVIAHRIGEPFGTLVLALAVTIIEVALIVSLMIAAGPDGKELARDTVFAAVMLILNGVVGLCLVAGAVRHHEQSFVQYGVSASLTVLAALATLTLVLPNYTTSLPGPQYTSGQLAFVAALSLFLYGTFMLVQTVRHRDYFLPPDRLEDETAHAPPPSVRTTWISSAFLLISLVVVVFLAKALAPAIEAGVMSAGAPKAVVGILISGLVLLPESIAAIRAARANRLQTSLNLALGSALATIGLTIPAVAILSLVTGLTLSLGLDAKSITLLALTLLVSTISLGNGRTTVLQGAVHLTILAAYIFTTVIP